MLSKPWFWPPSNSFFGAQWLWISMFVLRWSPTEALYRREVEEEEEEEESGEESEGEEVEDSKGWLLVTVDLQISSRMRRKRWKRRTRPWNMGDYGRSEQSLPETIPAKQSAALLLLQIKVSKCPRGIMGGGYGYGFVGFWCFLRGFAFMSVFFFNFGRGGKWHYRFMLSSCSYPRLGIFAQKNVACDILASASHLVTTLETDEHRPPRSWTPWPPFATWQVDDVDAPVPGESVERSGSCLPAENVTGNLVARKKNGKKLRHFNNFEVQKRGQFKISKMDRINIVLLGSQLGD